MGCARRAGYAGRDLNFSRANNSIPVRHSSFSLAPMNPLVSQHGTGRSGLTSLSVNVNKVALLRNSRHLGIPSVVKAAATALAAGANGITVHPRPDERHIRAADVSELAAMLKDWPQAEYNIEGNPFHNLIGFVQAQRPHQATFVPDSEGQATSDHGFDLAADGERLRPLIAQCRALGVRVSLFMDAEPAVMAQAAALGAQRVELYTEPYAAAHGTASQAAVLARFAATARAAQAAGLEVNAGHDLNRDNLADFLRAVPGVVEVSIGHALVADALELGMAATVRDYQRCIRQAFQA
jgi:pyridoxine 5-phosphate synthase